VLFHVHDNSLTLNTFRGRTDSCSGPVSKACRERLRREKLNDRHATCFIRFCVFSWFLFALEFQHLICTFFAFPFFGGFIHKRIPAYKSRSHEELIHLFFSTLFTWTAGWLAPRVITFSDFLSFFSPSL
jgi:hypothetical protein